MWIEDQIGVARAAIGDDRAREDLVVDVAEGLVQEEIEDLLVLDPLAVVHLIDSGGHFLAGEGEPGIEHSVHGGVDRGPLHLHEVGQRIVEIEYDGSDHDRPVPHRAFRWRRRLEATCSTDLPIALG